MNTITQPELAVPQVGVPNFTCSDGYREQQKAVFHRELNEVHLLLDFITGRSDKNFSALKISAAKGTKQLGPDEIVRKIAEMRFPRDMGRPMENADNAAFLLLAKDKLSSLAYPSKGLTIAYTSMFVGIAKLPSRRDTVTTSLPSAAFPGLASNARAFRLWFRLMVGMTFVCLLLTTLTYWDVAFGKSLGSSSDFLKEDYGGWVCHLLHLVCWTPLMPWTRDSNAAAVLSVFTTYVLPMMFGLLGTLISSIRSIQSKVRESVLSPRDFFLTFLILPIGMVAGIAVGLFFGDKGAAENGTTVLTAGAIAFLAGYGSEAFFSMMDTMLKAAFPSDQAPRASAHA